MDLDLIQRLVTPAQTKIVMLIMDGLGGLPREPGGRTELETARTPHLDALAERSNLGLSIPVAPGITPGSGPGHLALFGYDPIQYEIGRGAMEALGVDFELGPDDLAARGNYCTVGTDNCILDRRAGRISTEVNRHLSSLLSGIKLADAEIFIDPVKEHRFAFILRAAGLGDALSETDPQRTGIPPYPVHAMDERSQTSAIPGQPVHQRSPGGAKGPITRQHDPAARLCQAAGVASFPGALRPACSGYCGKWNVSRGCPLGGDAGTPLGGHFPAG